MIKYFIFIISIGFSASLSSQESIYDILPASSCHGIEVIGETELYVGDELFSLINGGAELYHEFGFSEVLTAEMLVPESGTLTVEIYDMGSPEAAWGIFSMTNASNSRPFYYGDAGRKGEGFAQFLKGNCMVYIYYDAVEDTALHYAAACLSENIELSCGPPKLMEAVDVREEKPEKVFYFKGNLGLSGIYNFHYKDVFGYDEGASAIYPDMKVILLNYENEGECIDKYNKAREFFMNSSKYHDQSSLRGSFHMRDRKEQQIDCLFENTFLIIFIHSDDLELNGIREAIVKQMES